MPNRALQRTPAATYCSLFIGGGRVRLNLGVRLTSADRFWWAARLRWLDKFCTLDGVAASPSWLGRRRRPTSGTGAVQAWRWGPPGGVTGSAPERLARLDLGSDRAGG